MSKTDLSRFSNPDYRPGKPLAIALWYVTSHLFFTTAFPFMAPKRVLLRLFGAHIGRGLVIKPKVNIKYPWKLHVGDHVWIGEHTWIDNLADVYIGNHCCISQGALLLCGNHDYKRPTFDLIVKPIHLEEGVWIGARAVVVQGLICKSHSVLGVGAVAQTDLEPYSIYTGIPAQKVRDRHISEL